MGVDMRPIGPAPTGVAVSAVNRPRYLYCMRCRSCITAEDRILSTAFRGFSGRAALFSDARRLTLAAPVVRLMVTGVHVMCEATCRICKVRLGWKIVSARDLSEKWKEQSFLLELERLSVDGRPDSSRSLPSAPRKAHIRSRSLQQIHIIDDAGSDTS